MQAEEQPLVMKQKKGFWRKSARETQKTRSGIEDVQDMAKYLDDIILDAMVMPDSSHWAKKSENTAITIIWEPI
jgi:hypothetical protein